MGLLRGSWQALWLHACGMYAECGSVPGLRWRNAVLDAQPRGVAARVACTVLPVVGVYLPPGYEGRFAVGEADLGTASTRTHRADTDPFMVYSALRPRTTVGEEGIPWKRAGTVNG